MNLDDGASPWDDEPSRNNSSQNLQKTAADAEQAATETPTKSQEASVSSLSSSTRSPVGRGPRGRRYAPASTRLESVDDPLGPLGGSSENMSISGQSEEPPAPPQKEMNAARAQRSSGPPSQASSVRGMMESVNLEDEEEQGPIGPRAPPPVQPPNNHAPPRQIQPSVSIEQAAKPTFNISVGDPHKVGGATSSHTEYQVRTKTTSKAYRNPEFSVSRRYRDFLWLYTQMHENNPGVIIPPPPEKQAVGRFDVDFVESRRQALERMLNKAAAHPILQHDADLKLFLESEAFTVDVKNKERKDPLLNESKGFMASVGISVGSGGKFIEHDDWFHDRRIYLDALENQLKALDKAVETVVTQRKTLAEACAEFSASLHSLAAVELSPSLSGPLDGLSDLQLRIRELYDRQAQQDVLTLGIVIDEYIRLIGSVKTAFGQRQKAYHSWHAAESEMQKRKQGQEKLLRQGRTQQDRLNQLNAEVADAERRVHQARLLFDDMGRLMRAELERFEKEKIEDFKSGVETYLESAVEAQKELIELWETYLMQLDSEEDGAPFGLAHPLAGITATPSAEDSAISTSTDRPVSQATNDTDETETTTDNRVAAEVTAAMEE